MFWLFYKWAILHWEYFKKRNLKHWGPRFLFENVTGIFLKQYSSNKFLNPLYYRFSKKKNLVLFTYCFIWFFINLMISFSYRLIGLFDMREPVYLPRDLDFIRQITIKDFGHFEDHVIFMDCESCTLFR